MGLWWWIGKIWLVLWREWKTPKNIEKGIRFSVANLQNKDQCAWNRTTLTNPTITMGARKRLSSSSEPSSAVVKEDTQNKPQEKLNLADPPIAPPKWGLLLKLSLLLLPYLYLLFYYYPIEPELRRSILINAGMSLAGLFVTVKMIPVASRYVQKRNLFGYDINKKGTPQGNVKVLVFFFVSLFYFLLLWSGFVLDFWFRDLGIYFSFFFLNHRWVSGSIWLDLGGNLQSGI